GSGFGGFPGPGPAVGGGAGTVWRRLAFTFNAIGVAVLFAGDLGPVPDQETGVAREFVLRLRDDLDYQLLGDEFPAGDHAIVQGVSLVQLSDDAARVRGA